MRPNRSLYVTAFGVLLGCSSGTLSDADNDTANPHDSNGTAHTTTTTTTATETPPIHLG